MRDSVIYVYIYIFVYVYRVFIFIFLAVLIPLFGLHFIISAFVPDSDYTPYGARSIFDTITAVTTSFQVCNESARISSV